jgi:hypothetical protein
MLHINSSIEQVVNARNQVARKTTVNVSNWVSLVPLSANANSAKTTNLVKFITLNQM